MEHTLGSALITAAIIAAVCRRIGAAAVLAVFGVAVFFQ